MNQNTSKTNFFSEWLEKLQQESWQLELLISGLALFGIWESQSVIHSLEYYLQVNSVSEIRFAASIFLKFLWAAWIIFLINLLIHIIIRGFWIGAIGLRYVSGDIDFEALNYSEKFINHYKRKIGSYDEYIEKLEKISSVLFSFTFLLFFMFLSLLVFNLVFITVISILLKFFPDSRQSLQNIIAIIGILYYGLGLLVLIDFLSLGAFKKIKDSTVSSIYLWIYRFYSSISLSFLYRPLLLNFIDNTYTRKLFYLAIPYSLILWAINGIYFERYPLFPSFDYDSRWKSVSSEGIINWNYYDDLRDEHNATFKKGDSHLIKSKINYISLNKYEHDTDEMKLFLEYREKDEDYIGYEKEEIPLFRKKGIRHTTLLKNNLQDPELVKLEEQEYKEATLLRKILRKETTPDSIDQHFLSDYEGYSIDDYDQLREDIKEKYRLIRDDYLQMKLKRIINGFKELYTVKIDSVHMNPAMECHFYEHPNMHEKGLMCYIAIDSMSRGTHILHVTKRNHEVDCTENCSTVVRSIPFRKLN